MFDVKRSVFGILTHQKNRILVLIDELLEQNH